MSVPFGYGHTASERATKINRLYAFQMEVAIPDASDKSCRKKIDLVLFLERQNFIARDGACANVKSPHGEKHVREFTEG